MKLFKGFVFVLLGLFIMVTIFSLFIPSKVMTAKAVVIHSPKDTILQELNELKHWKNWHPVFKAADATLRFSEPSAGVNASVHWITSGKTNTLKITGISPEETRFTVSREGENDIENVLSVLPVQEESGLQVQWRSVTHLKWYPWEKFAGIFIEKMTGPGYEAALNSLRQYLEAHN